MSTSAVAGTGGRRRPSTRLIGIAVVVVVVVAIALDTTYKDPDTQITASGRPAFDPASYGEKTYPKAVDTLEQKATPVPQLLAELRKDQEGASERLGHHEGNSPYSFAVSGEGVAGKAKDGVLPVKVKGVPGSTQVAIQTGPALPGTSIRDAVGFISFGQFVNQVEYADAATALNSQVKAQLLNDLKPASLEGKKVRFLGAFTLLAPTAVTITPVRLEAAS